MNESQLEMLTNLVTNPYTLVFFAFTIGIGYFMLYIRRFYPDSVREEMEKEESCMLEFQQKPEMGFIRKIFFYGGLGSIVVSYFIVYHILEDIENKFKMAEHIFLTLAVIIMIISGVLANKINKDENCNDVMFGYKYFKFPNFILTMLVFMGVILSIAYLANLIFIVK